MDAGHGGRDGRDGRDSAAAWELSAGWWSVVVHDTTIYRRYSSSISSIFLSYTTRPWHQAAKVLTYHQQASFVVDLHHGIGSAGRVPWPVVVL